MDKAKLELIEGFSDAENLREIYNKPWLSGGEVVATNGSILIAVPEKLVEGHGYRMPTPEMKEPGWRGVFKPSTEWGLFNTDALDEALASVEPVFEVEPKKLCWHCGNSNCNCGQKLYWMNPEAGREHRVLTLTKYDGRWFDWHKLKMLKDVMEEFGGEWKGAVGEAHPSYQYKGLPDLLVSPMLLWSDQGVRMALMPCDPHDE